MNPELKTIVVDNFSGKLVKEIHGDLNSGFCPFVSSFGGVYPLNASAYPSQLTFMEDGVSIGGAGILSPILHFWNVANPANGSIAAAIGPGIDGTFYIVSSAVAGGNPDGDSIGTYINSVGYNLFYNGGLYVGSLTNTATVAYVGHDSGVSVSSELRQLVATWSVVGATTSYQANVPRPLVGFLGKIYAGNGNNIAEIITGNTVSSYSKLSPGLPSSYTIRDMAISNDGRYLVMIASFLNDPTTTLKIDGTSATLGNQRLYSATDSILVLWNGTDQGYSSIQYFKGINLSSISVSNTETVLFGKDDEGVGIWDVTGNKIITIPDLNNTTVAFPVLPGNSYVLGKKIFFWMEISGTVYLFCLNREDNSLYCLWSKVLAGEKIKGAITVPSIHANDSNFNDISRVKAYISLSKNPISTQPNNLLYYQHLQDYGGNNFAGSYSTQVQKFARKVKPTEIRIYTNGTSSNESWTISLISSSGASISGTSSIYTFASGTDRSQAQGSLNCIKFNLTCEPIQEFGIKIVSSGIETPSINKIEIDYVDILNPQTI